MVRARRRGDRLQLLRRPPQERAQLEAMAAALLAATQQAEGAARAELERAWSRVGATAVEHRSLAALRKLIEDGCVFAEQSSDEAQRLREALFVRAAKARRAAASADAFCRRDVLTQAARDLELEPQVLQHRLFADLRQAQRLEQAPIFTAAELVERLPLAEVQALLLRATALEVQVELGGAPSARRFFHRLRFLGLLATVQEEKSEAGKAYRLVIEGPHSLFVQTTKYGLRLAQMVPLLCEARRWSLSSDLVWGKDKRLLHFTVDDAFLQLPQMQREVQAQLGARAQARSGAQAQPPGLTLRPELVKLCEAWPKLGCEWKARSSRELLVGKDGQVVVPDVVFVHEHSQRRVYLEVLGHWSRDAVWRRLDMAHRGLKSPLLLAAPSKLRVSEAVVEDEEALGLYLYRSVLRPREVLRRIEALAGRIRDTP